jgi:hypothetical protein
MGFISLVKCEAEESHFQEEQELNKRYSADGVPKCPQYRYFSTVGKSSILVHPIAYRVLLAFSLVFCLLVYSYS